MISVNMLLVSLENHIIRTNFRNDRLFRTLSVLLMTSEETEIDNDCIYIADADTANEVLSGTRDVKNLILFVAGDLPDIDSLCENTGANVCTTDLSYVQLHNKLCRTIEIYRCRQRKLDKDVNADNAFTILYNASNLAESSNFFLSSNHQIIASSSRTEHIALLQGIIDYNNSSIEQKILPIFGELDNCNGCACIGLENKLNLCAAIVGENSRIHGYLLAASNEETEILRQITLQTAATLAHNLAKGGAFDKKRLSFQTLAEKLLLPQKPPANLDELQIQLQRLPIIPKKYMRGIIIRPSTEFSSKLEKIAERAAQVFQKSNVAILNDELYVLISSNYSTCPMNIDNDELNSFLENYKAYAIIGNPSKTTKTLRTMYLQCKAVFDVTLRVRYQLNGRWFYFERFSQYYIIDVCARYLQEELGTEDIIYLCNPGVLAITRYDRTNQSDLRDVLFNYLMNRCSISKTAEKMFMHRNTVIYKINKIEEILGQSMDDPYLRHSLIFSCMLIRYRENYQEKRISLDVFERTTPEEK